MTVINDDSYYDNNDNLESQNLINKIIKNQSPQPNWDISLRDNGKFNIIILGISFCILFSAFSPTQELQTTINKDLGAYTLSVLYFVLSISNFISPIIVLKLGERMSLILSTISYVIYVASNIYVTKPSLFISSILVGFGGSILWTAQGSLVIKCSTDSTIGENTGLFFALFQTDQIIGNLGTATLINKAGLSNEILFTIFTCVASIPIIGFLIMGKPIKKDDYGLFIKKDNEEHEEIIPLKDRLMSTVILLKDNQMQLLIPSFLYSGISQAFFFGVFSALIGKDWIGYVMSVFGLCDAIGSFAIGKLSDKIGRKILIITSTLFCIVGSVFTYLSSDVDIIIGNADYKGDVKTIKLLFQFIAAGLFGLADAGYNTQICSLIGVLYPNKGESAYSVFKFFQSIATAIAFIYCPYIILFQSISILNIFVISSCILFIFADKHSNKF